MGKLNMDLVHKQKQTLEHQNNGFDKLVNGNNIRRILWPKGDSEEISSEGLIHFGMGEEGKSSIVCRKTESSSAYCPICEHIEKLQKSKDKNDNKLGAGWKAKKRVYYNVLERTSDGKEHPNFEVKILAAGSTIQRQIVSILCDPDYGDITDYESGRDVTIKRSGQGLNTEYTVLPKPAITVASSFDKDKVEESMTDLKALWTVPSVEDCQKLLAASGVLTEGSDTQMLNSGDDYDEMSLEELTELCEQRGLELPEKVSKFRLITLLTQDDANDEGDDVKSSISNALNRRK